MHCYKINGLSITATSKEEAELVARELFDRKDKESVNRIMFVYDDGTIQTISLKNQSCFVFSQSGNSVTRVGKMVSGTGQQIIQAAVNSIDNSNAASAKFRANKKKAARLAKESEFDEIIAAFENKIPEKAKVSFDSVMTVICGSNKFYLVEIYQEIDANVIIDPGNWFRILQWFRSNVIDAEGEETQFVKRKAFVTTVCRMGEEPYQVGNPIQRVIDNDKEFWSKYADKNK